MRVFLAFLILPTLIACSDSSNTGSTPCEEYKGSLCAYRAECGVTSESSEECLALVDELTCVTERLATECAMEIEAATCFDEPSSGCDFEEVIDTTAEVEACFELQAETCEIAASECGAASASYLFQECLDRWELAFPCDRAAKVERNVAPCVESVIPDACRLPDFGEACDDIISQW